MKDYHYIPTKGAGVKTYVFRAELVEEADGRWSAGVPTLPGCATWGDTRAEALHNIRDAVDAYIRVMQRSVNKGCVCPSGSLVRLRTLSLCSLAALRQNRLRGSSRSLVDASLLSRGICVALSGQNVLPPPQRGSGRHRRRRRSGAALVSHPFLLPGGNSISEPSPA